MRKVEIVLGILVLLGALFFAGVLWVSWKGGRHETYSVRVIFSDAGGIAEGDPVYLSGVRIGRVERIALQQEDYRALMTLSVDKKISLPVDTEVSLVSANFLSGKYVRLLPGRLEAVVGDGSLLRNVREYQSLEAVVSKALSGALSY